MKDSNLHPVRFTNRQIESIKHIMSEFCGYFEKEAKEFFNTIRESEKDMENIS